MQEDAKIKPGINHFSTCYQLAGGCCCFWRGIYHTVSQKIASISFGAWTIPFLWHALKIVSGPVLCSMCSSWFVLSLLPVQSAKMSSCLITGKIPTDKTLIERQHNSSAQTHALSPNLKLHDSLQVTVHAMN